MVVNIAFLAGGLVYGFAQFFLSSRLTKSVLASDVIRAALFIGGKFILYAALFALIALYKGEGRIWALGGYGVGLCIPAISFAIVKILGKGDDMRG